MLRLLNIFFLISECFQYILQSWVHWNALQRKIVWNEVRTFTTNYRVGSAVYFAIIWMPGVRWRQHFYWLATAARGIEAHYTDEGLYIYITCTNVNISYTFYNVNSFCFMFSTILVTNLTIIRYNSFPLIFALPSSKTVGQPFLLKRHSL